MKENKLINPICDVCKKELKDFGALLFSPPNNENIVKKYHICVGCYDEIINKIDYPCPHYINNPYIDYISKEDD